VDVLADTNILLRRIHRADPQHRLVRDALNRVQTEGHRLCVTSQNLIELWTVCTRPVENNGLGLTSALIDRILSRVEGTMVRLPDMDGTYAEWRRLVVLHGVSGKKTHDARLVAAMNVLGVSRILTFNVGDFTRYTEIQAVHPAQVDLIGSRPR
jgi:predicted nucleic acid-binding protein